MHLLYTEKKDWERGGGAFLLAQLTGEGRKDPNKTKSKIRPYHMLRLGVRKSAFCWQLRGGRKAKGYKSEGLASLFNSQYRFPMTHRTLPLSNCKKKVFLLVNRSCFRVCTRKFLRLSSLRPGSTNISLQYRKESLFRLRTVSVTTKYIFFLSSFNTISLHLLCF